MDGRSADGASQPPFGIDGYLRQDFVTPGPTRGWLGPQLFAAPWQPAMVGL